MKNPIVELVEPEMAHFNQLWSEDRNRPPDRRIFPDKDNLYPIPFFGDIRRAEVVTLALNPSHTEFTPGRWPANGGPEALTPDGLTNRLLSYFHSRKNNPNDWFEACEQGLLALGCSYKRNAAHIDVHPLPTKRGRERNEAETELLAQTIREHCANHIISVLAVLDRLKLIVVVDYSVPLEGGGHVTTFDYVKEHLSAISGLVDSTGVEPPVVRGGDQNKIASHLFGHRIRLQSFLLNAPSLIFSY